MKWLPINPVPPVTNSFTVRSGFFGEKCSNPLCAKLQHFLGETGVGAERLNQIQLLDFGLDLRLGWSSLADFG
jgi:hypothetical protein